MTDTTPTLVMGLEKNPAALNFVAVRPGAMTHLINANLPPDGASGGIWLACPRHRLRLLFLTAKN